MCTNYWLLSWNRSQGILSVPSSVTCIPVKQCCVQQYQYPGNFISKDRQLKQNWGQWNTKQRESHWLKHLKAREWETSEEKENDSITFHLSVTHCARGHKCTVNVSVCLHVCLQKLTPHYLCVSVHVWTYSICECCACYAWRHTCSNRVVVESDSCPVPFTAQSFQPPLCSVRLLMRINVLWRPLGLPRSPQHSR